MGASPDPTTAKRNYQDGELHTGSVAVKGVFTVKFIFYAI